MEGLVLNCVEIPVKIQDVEILLNLGIFLDLEAQNQKHYLYQSIGGLRTGIVYIWGTVGR